MSSSVKGVGLFSGEEATVEVVSTTRATELFTPQGGGPLDSWSVASAFRTTKLVHPSGAEVACVEHLFAALAAFGAHHGVSISVQGPELPILDGAAAAWCALLDEVGVESSPPHLEITRDEELTVQGSTYRFRKASTPRVSVQIDLETAGSFAASLPKRAEWDGTRAAFVGSIARARTFILERDLAAHGHGAEAHAPPESFLVIGEDGAIGRGRPFEAEEPARHKLLDLMGDLFAAGGPPWGSLEAVRPGHARNREAMRLAAELGIVHRR